MLHFTQIEQETKEETEGAETVMEDTVDVEEKMDDEDSGGAGDDGDSADDGWTVVTRRK